MTDLELIFRKPSISALSPLIVSATEIVRTKKTIMGNHANDTQGKEAHLSGKSGDAAVSSVSAEQQMKTINPEILNAGRSNAKVEGRAVLFQMQGNVSREAQFEASTFV